VKLFLRLAFLFTATFLAAQLASAITMGQIDTFQTGTTEGWFAGGLGMGMLPPTPPQVVSTGGPAGVGDQFLEITADTDTGAGSRVVAINGAQWAGNYLAAGISAISMDLKNLGGTDLTIRLLLEDPMNAPPVDEAVTTFGAVLPAGTDWTNVVFPISPASLTVLQGNATTLLGNTILLRIINSPVATEGAARQMGVLGVDNIQAAVPEPATFLLAGMALTALGLSRRRNKLKN
jgi:hypothetical protein